MRFLCEIVLDKTTDSEANPEAIAAQVMERFMLAGQRMVVANAEEADAEYRIMSARAWHDEGTARAPGQHMMSDAER